MKKRLLPALLLLLLSTGLRSQDVSSLYRGVYPTSYPFKYNGHVYWDSKEYEKSTLRYNGKEYEDILLNINAYKQEILVVPDKTSFPVILYRDQVAWVKKKDQLYVNLRYLGFEKAPEGFFQVLKDGETPILSQITKRFASSSQDQNGKAIGYYDPNYNTEVVNYFSRVETFYLLREDGRLQKISRSKARKLLKNSSEDSPIIAPRLHTWHSTSLPGGELSARTARKSGIGLPEGYFREVLEDTVQVVYDTPAQQTTYKNKIYVVGEGDAKGSVTVKGHVKDLETDLPLPEVLIYDELTKTYVRTDAKGAYSIQLPGGENILHFSYEGKEALDLQVDLRGSGVLDITMTEQVTLLQEAVISANSMQQHRTTSMGLETVNIKTVGKIPSAFGEGDVMKAVLTLPGVKTVGEASGGFNVRGGAADENLILFNENTIYNPSHLFGIFSSFNPDIVENVELYKSSIPAEYGGRLSSVMKVSSREGDPARIHAALGIGLLTSRAQLEGPLVKGKTTFVLGGRTTYSNWILNRLPKNSSYSGAQAGFYDINAGITHRFSPKDALSVSFYLAQDRFTLEDNVTNRYGNINASVIFRHRDAGASSWLVAAGYDRYTNLTGDHSWDHGAYDLTTRINQAFAKGWWKKSFGKHEIGAGGQVTAYFMEPGIMEPYGAISRASGHLPAEQALEPSLHVSDLFTLSHELSLEAGVRLLGFISAGDGKNYWGPELRLAGKYSPLETLSFKAAFNTMRQNIHLISNTSGISPMDTWKLSDANIRPTTAWQGSAGVYWTFVDWGLDVSAETYWKQSRQALDYLPGAKLSMNERLFEDLIPIHTRSYGVELMIKKPAGKLTGWISYSYSRARFREMEDRGNATIAGGDWYNAPYDKPHEFKLVGNWAITRRYSISVNVDYSTGRPVTVPIGRYYLKDAFRIAYSERNVHRIPDYFRVDLALNIDPGHYLKALAHSSITIGVYNVLGRKNPYSVYFRTNESGQVEGHMLSVFATQVPYINLNFLF